MAEGEDVLFLPGAQVVWSFTCPSQWCWPVHVAVVCSVTLGFLFSPCVP